MIPLTFHLMVLIGRPQEKSDARLRLVNEILQGMRLIKLRAWENVFEERTRETREQELKLLDKDSVYWAFISKRFRFRSTRLISVDPR